MKWYQVIVFFIEEDMPETATFYLRSKLTLDEICDKESGMINKIREKIEQVIENPAHFVVTPFPDLSRYDLYEKDLLLYPNGEMYCKFDCDSSELIVQTKSKTIH